MPPLQTKGIKNAKAINILHSITTLNYIVLSVYLYPEPLSNVLNPQNNPMNQLLFPIQGAVIGEALPAMQCLGGTRALSGSLGSWPFGWCYDLREIVPGFILTSPVDGWGIEYMERGNMRCHGLNQSFQHVRQALQSPYFLSRPSCYF